MAVQIENDREIRLNPTEEFGIEQTTAEDRAYTGSRFSEVREGHLCQSLSARLGR